MLNYCSAVRGILNEDQGGPLSPSGLRMRGALLEGAGSIERCIVREKSAAGAALRALRKRIEHDINLVSKEICQVAEYTLKIGEVWNLLDSNNGTSESRQAKFVALAANLSVSDDPTYKHMGKTMLSFQKGLFAGNDDPELPIDNLDLERAFRLPESHERHVHGNTHAGVRIIQQGASLLLVLNTYERLSGVFEVSELLPYALPCARCAIGICAAA